MPFVDRGDDLFDADWPVIPPDLLPQFLDIGERLADLSLPAMRLGDYPSNGTAMAGVMIVSPRSMSSSKRDRWALASDAWISRMRRSPIGQSN
jgi:hypothetical protein